jgi:hypothetical protein
MPSYSTLPWSMATDFIHHGACCRSGGRGELTPTANGMTQAMVNQHAEGVRIGVEPLATWRGAHPFWLSIFSRASRLTEPSCHLMLVESPTWYAVVPSVPAAKLVAVDEPTHRVPVTAAGVIPAPPHGTRTRFSSLDGKRAFGNANWC